MDRFRPFRTPTNRIEDTWRTKTSPSSHKHGHVRVVEGSLSSTNSVSTSLLPGSDQERARPIGTPRRKRHIDPLDLLALVVSIICSILAIISVRNEHVAWRLRVGNQLIVAGFLLSVMNLCLTRITSFFFILMEARFGRSTLQNFDGILLNQVFSARLDVVWRFLLFCCLAFPILLSVGYKRFIDGSSELTVNGTAITGLGPEFGLFSPPDVSKARGSGFGFSFYFNASMPFRLASSPPIAVNPIDPPLPNFYPTPYGANTLVLNKQSTAMLDLPRDTRLILLQEYLGSGDSMDLFASVHGTVATQNNDHLVQDDPAFIAACMNKTMSITSLNLVNPEGTGVHLLAPVGTADQTTFWLGLGPYKYTWDNLTEQCNAFAGSSRRYDITRRNCSAHWSITRGGFTLANGSCETDILPITEQYVFQGATFYLGGFVTQMAEAVGVYSEMRPNSGWKDPAMTTFAASISWSAFMALNSQSNYPETIIDGTFGTFFGRKYTNGELGVIYEVINETITTTRSTLQKSVWLYLIFASQPAILLILMIATALMYSTPLAHGFGIVSILAGINRNTLDLLQGASLSGKLQHDVQLSIFPVHPKDSAETAIEYRVEALGDGLRKGRISSATTYY